MMECLVDTVNSNIFSNCSKCGLDGSSSSSSSFSSTTEVSTQCDQCTKYINGAVVNNNAMIQTHRDFVPLATSLVTRPRCCSCLEQSSPKAPSSDFREPVAGLDIPVSRPRSSSSPNYHSHKEQPSCTECSSTFVSARLTSSSEPPHSSQVNQQHNSPHSPVVHHSGASCEQYQKSVRLSEKSPNSSCLHLNSISNEDGNISESCHHSCPNCGAAGSVGDVELKVPDLTSASANVNTQQNLLYRDLSLLLPPSSPSKAPAAPSFTPTTTASPVSIQVDEPQTRLSPWDRKSYEFLPKAEDTKAQEPPLTFKQCLDVPADEAVVPKSDKGPATSRFDSPSAYLTTSEIISHNMKINRITTATSRTPQSAKVTRKVQRELRLTGAPTRPLRHSLHSTRDCPMIITPDSPLPCLPSALLYELHDLGHENEDLSAEVVYSLHFRDYQIKELLGKGISSTVRRVTEKSTGAEFAVKIIDISGEKGELSQVEQVKKDTFREIKILRMCAGHSNIIELHDVFETPTFIFLVFEICKKGELFDYLTSVVSLSEKRTRIFMRQLIEAVAFIHDKNIVHRDLKPENILLDDNLNIKVSDFGFATVVEPGEELTELCGTPGYLAPEVLAHSMYENVSGYGKEVDMWACGVIMYTLLCGAPPFWNRRQMMMLRAIMNADYTFNSPEWDDITEPPKNLIQKLLVVNPKDRLTAKEALKHPFFHSRIAEEKKFMARRKFRAAVSCVMFYLRLSFFYKHPPPISADMVCSNPYGIKLVRKVIDTCAFSMYKHWVKRVDNQNRAALFEHTLRDDWKHSPMTFGGFY